MIFRLIPSLLSSLRLIIAPVLALNIYNYELSVVLWLISFAGFSDFLDGYLARRFKVESSFGAWLDVSADFAVVFFAFTALMLKGLISVWVVVVVMLMFVQFVLSSVKSLKPIYDPVGKYYGALLLFSLVLIVVFQDSNVVFLVTIAIILFSLVSFSNRMFKKVFV